MGKRPTEIAVMRETCGCIRGDCLVTQTLAGLLGPKKPACIEGVALDFLRLVVPG